MTALSRSIGNSIFDSNPVFDKREPRAARPTDGWRELQQSLNGSTSGAALQRTGLPDFLQAAQQPGASTRLLDAAPVAFSVARNDSAAISISSLATAASARSGGFSSLDDQITAGTLNLKVNGASYNVAIAQGATLKDVVGSVRALGADVNATVERDAGLYFLRITNRSTGYDTGGAPDDALTITETSSGSDGKQLGARIDNVATNAAFTINGVSQLRRQNLITDAQSGTSVDLTKVSAGIAPALAPDTFAEFGPGSASGPGRRYVVSVESLAQAAEARSALFSSEKDLVKAGTLSLAVEGRRFNVTVNDGDTLAAVRQRIEDSGAGSASIVNDSGGVRLSITSRQKGFPLRGTPADALSVSETSTGSSGQSLGATVRAATNAVVRVNGTATTSRSDTVTGAVPGFTLSLKKVSFEGGGEVITLPAPGRKPPVNVDNAIDRVLQAQLLTTRGIAPPQEEDKLNQVRQRNDAAEKVGETRRPAAGGNESSRNDILDKLTAVDGIFGGLRSASQFLSALSSSSADAQ
jgi:flagellar capping protein FliD